MAMNECYETKKLSEMVETYASFSKNQAPIIGYPVELLPARKQIVEWVIFVCQNLSFKSETLYRAISIYDSFTSKTQPNINSLQELKLSAVACLSIATKLEELNCNFISFFTQNVLNEEGSEYFSQSDLTEKEIEVLKVLSFKTNKSNVFHFSSIFLQICYNSIRDVNNFNWLVSLNDQMLRSVIKEECSVFNSPIQSALFAINESLKQLSLSQKEAEIINNSVHYLMTRANGDDELLSRRTFVQPMYVNKKTINGKSI